MFETILLLYKTNFNWMLFDEDPGVYDQIIIWKDLIRTIVNSMVAIFAIVGGFLVFFQYMQGNDQAQKNFIKFIIGLAIMGLINMLVTFFTGTIIPMNVEVAVP